jgi:hypothetical protein
MGTRSAIIYRLDDGRYRGVQCTHDSYLDITGRILRDHYRDPQKVKRLMDHGAISELGERIDPVGPHSYDEPEAGTTVFYRRDRGEVGKYLDAAIRTTVEELAEELAAEGRVYVFEGGRWSFNGHEIALGDLPRDDEEDWPPRRTRLERLLADDGFGGATS